MAELDIDDTDIYPGESVGASCALCHSTTDGSIWKPAAGERGGNIGERLDGLANHELSSAEPSPRGKPRERITRPSRSTWRPTPAILSREKGKREEVVAVSGPRTSALFKSSSGITRAVILTAPAASRRRRTGVRAGRGQEAGFFAASTAASAACAHSAAAAPAPSPMKYVPGLPS